VTVKGGTMSLGMTNAAASLSDYFGTTADSYIILLPGTTAEFFTGNSGQGGAVSTGNTGGAPFTLCLAIDGPNKKFAAKFLGQQWMPGANTDLDESVMKSFAALTGTLYLAMSSDATGDSATIRSVSADMLGVIPTGYQAVDA
jgi:hypothetical protein